MRFNLYHRRLSGKYYDMGVKYGKTLRRVGYKPPKLTDKRMQFARESEKEVKRVFPEILEEIQGFADGCVVPYKDLCPFIINIGIKQPTGCSCFASVLTTSSRPIMGRNYDWYYEIQKYTESYLTMPKGAYWSLGNSDIFVGREDGLNECGLAVAMALVSPKEFKPGINFALIVRALLDKCTNVSEALNFLENISYLRSDNYLLVDKEGDMAVVEVSPRKIRVRRPEEGVIVATNHFVHCEMKEEEDVSNRSPTSLQRYQRIESLLKKAKGRLDLNLARCILSDHEGLVCSHREEIKLGTIWSFICSPSENTVLMATGHPCKKRYKEDERLKRALDKRLTI